MKSKSNKESIPHQRELAVGRLWSSFFWHSFFQHMKLLRCSAGVWVWKCAVRLVPEDLTRTGVTAIPFEGSEMIVCAVCM